MSGDRVERGASSPAPRRPSQLFQPGPRQDPADDLPQALAVACGLQAEPPTQQPTSFSRDFVPNPAPSHRRLPEIETASDGAGFVTTALARHQNVFEMNAGHENRVADSSSTTAAASSSRARSGSASIRSDTTGAASTAMASSPDAGVDEAASATGGPNRSSLFLPPFENLEVPGADSTHR